MRGIRGFNETHAGKPSGKRKEKRPAHRAGRSAGLIEKRNELIMYRYYFYGVHNGMRWEEVSKILGREFFLSAVTVIKIIESHGEMSRRIIEEEPSIAKLKRKYDFLRWELYTIVEQS